MSDFTDNQKAIENITVQVINGMNFQIDGILEKHINIVTQKLTKAIVKLYKNFKVELLKNIGTSAATESIGPGGGIIPFTRLSDSLHDRKTKKGISTPNFFFFEGTLRSFLTGNIFSILGKPIINSKGVARGRRDRRIQIDKQGRARIRGGKTIGVQKGGQFVAELRKLVFTVNPVVFPRTEGLNNKKVNKLFPEDISARLFNTKRPFRPLIGPLLKIYKSRKLRQAIKEATGV